MEPIALDDTITLHSALVQQLKEQGLIPSQAVEEAFIAVPRHIFVPEVDLKTAYSDAPVITKWQDGHAISSSSQPAIMALMLEMLQLRPGQRVLEVGAGTGYNAALIAHIVGETGQVVTIDVDEDIVEAAQTHLQLAGATHVQVVCRDGAEGWPEAAPYDRIILTVGSFIIAPAWHEQLSPGGRLLLPLHLTNLPSDIAMPPDQWLVAFERTSAGYLESIEIRPCLFMPLRGALAASPANISTLGASPGITCITYSPIDTDAAYHALQSLPQSEDTAISLAFQEISGLRLWLALHEPRFCELSVKGDLVQDSTIPSLTGRSGSPIVTVGLYEQSTWALLLLTTPSADQESDPQHPFQLVIRRFGPHQALAHELKEHMNAWVNAGRPFTWSPQGTMERLCIRAYLAKAGYQKRPNEMAITRGETQIVFKW